MSGYTGGIKKGDVVQHKGREKTIKDWYFTSEPIHNGDLIVIQFTDGTSTGREGFREVEFDINLPDNI